jgi:hypothetical protein
VRSHCINRRFVGNGGPRQQEAQSGADCVSADDPGDGGPKCGVVTVSRQPAKEHRADDGDTERAAELLCGAEDAGRPTGATCGDAGENDVDEGDDKQTQADACD